MSNSSKGSGKKPSTGSVTRRGKDGVSNSNRGDGPKFSNSKPKPSTGSTTKRGKD